VPGGAGDFLLISASDFAALPMSGAGWSYLDAKATDGRTQITFNEDGSGYPAATTDPNLRDYQSSQTSGRYTQKAMAVAARYAREKVGGVEDAADLAWCEDWLSFIIGTDESDPGVASPDGTSTNDQLLAVGRNLAAAIIVADFIDLDGDALFGSRAGTSSRTSGPHSGVTYANPIQGDAWTATSFNDWLAATLNTKLGSRSAWHTIRQNMYRQATNQGAAMIMSYTLAVLWLDKQGWTAPSTVANSLWVSGQPIVPMVELTDIWRRWLGDLSAAYDPPADIADDHWFDTSDTDTAYWNVPAGESWGTDLVWRPINADTPTAAKSGIVIEDIARSTVSYPSYDDTGREYVNEHLHFVLTGARAMQVAGYDVENWTDKRADGSALSATPTLLRAGEWIDSVSEWPRMGTTVIHDQLAWQMNWILGTSYTAQQTGGSPAGSMGRGSSFNDWLSGAR
jgi:hypothetical protein